MIPRPTEPTGPPQERAILVGVEWKTTVASGDATWPLAASLEELAQLAHTAGIAVVGELTQRLDHPEPSTFIGSGKVKELVLQVAEAAADVVIFDDELSPRHQRELEKALGDDVKLLDRTALILDIFAQHAHTREGNLQVELAQYQYRLPRLTRAWTHLARQAGGRAGGTTGGVGVRGPGETQLETDRRVIGQRIVQLKKELEKVRAHRGLHRARRKREGIPVISIVGYTNAGKSTLLNCLSDADVLVEDKLFATLDPTTRRVVLPNGRPVLFTDTVGFIQKLPTHLVAAFRATLEETTESDLLLHVLDATHPQALRQARAVLETLEDIGAAGKPMVTALNKVDRLADPQAACDASAELPHCIPISALTGYGMENLLRAVEKKLESDLVRVDLVIPFARGDLVQLIHQQGQVENEEYSAKGARIRALVPRSLASILDAL
ncbi:MAG: GTPase HflX [Anaerolineae bacterium]|nr:GTPase HflX [Anaerolineae bacterium]